MRQPITLTDQERQYLQMFVHRGKANARTLTRARLLLKVAEGWKDQEIVAAFDICQATVTNVCKRYARSADWKQSCTIRCSNADGKPSPGCKRLT
jgi:hypothetical protein